VQGSQSGEIIKLSEMTNPREMQTTHMHGSPVSSVGSMQVVTAAHTDMDCQRSSRIIYSRSLECCLMIRESCRT